MKYLFLITFIVCYMELAVTEKYCNVPNDCQVKRAFNREKLKMYKAITCLLRSGSKLEFSIDSNGAKNEDNRCKSLHKNAVDLHFKPSSSKSPILTKNVLNVNNLMKFTSIEDIAFINVIFDSFKGFDIDLFELNTIEFTDTTEPIVFSVSCFECFFEFYKDDKKIESCKEMSKKVDRNGTRSIFQIYTLLKPKSWKIVLSEINKPICPLAFQNSFIQNLGISGYISFMSRRTLTFTNDTFDDLNAVIIDLSISVFDANIDFNFLNPSVFNRLEVIVLERKVNSIHPDLFNRLNLLRVLELNNEYFRSIMHNQGIEWIKSINKGLHVNFSNINNSIENITKTKYIALNCNSEYGLSISLLDLFPEEDFCLYKEFPFNQLVYIIETCDIRLTRKRLPCTFLYLIQYYELFLPFFDGDSGFFIITNFYTNLEEYKSISNYCNFEKMLHKCNKSEFKVRPIRTNIEIGESVYFIKLIFHISSYPLLIFGIVTNILVIITISHKENEADFKGLKQYEYLRIYSFINCLILVIYFSTWLNRCDFPFQVFCSQIRKEIFLQYFKIIVQGVIFTSLQFMNNFIYIAFAFNRISLIGKDHNKLVIFISDAGLKKYIAISLVFSIVFSVIKLFSYRINYGQPYLAYPIDYNYQSVEFLDSKINLAYFILNSISDLLNYCVLLFVHLFIDIGMVVKLRETLNGKLEKIKSMISKEDLEKKRRENETVLNNAILMVVVNSSIGFLLKFPICIYSILLLVFNIYRINDPTFINHIVFARFYLGYWLNANICEAFLQLSDFLYLMSISIPIFVYKHFDKKIKITFERIFKK